MKKRKNGLTICTIQLLKFLSIVKTGKMYKFHNLYFKICYPYFTWIEKNTLVEVARYNDDRVVSEWRSILFSAR